MYNNLASRQHTCTHVEYTQTGELKKTPEGLTVQALAELVTKPLVVCMQSSCNTNCKFVIKKKRSTHSGVHITHVNTVHRHPQGKA